MVANTVSRRSAIGAALSGLAAAGAAAAIPSESFIVDGSGVGPSLDRVEPPHAVSVTATIVAPMLAKVVHADDLAEASRRLRAEYREATASENRAYDALYDQLSPEQRRLLIDVSDTQAHVHNIGEELHFANLARHLPGLYPVLRLLWLHVDLETECCTVAKGFEP